MKKLLIYVLSALTLLCAAAVLLLPAAKTQTAAAEAYDLSGKTISASSTGKKTLYSNRPLNPAAYGFDANYPHSVEYTAQDIAGAAGAAFSIGDPALSFQDGGSNVPYYLPSGKTYVKAAYTAGKITIEAVRAPERTANADGLAIYVLLQDGANEPKIYKLLVDVVCDIRVMAGNGAVPPASQYPNNVPRQLDVGGQWLIDIEKIAKFNADDQMGNSIFNDASAVTFFRPEMVNQSQKSNVLVTLLNSDKQILITPEKANATENELYAVNIWFQDTSGNVSSVQLTYYFHVEARKTPEIWVVEADTIVYGSETISLKPDDIAKSVDNTPMWLVADTANPTENALYNNAGYRNEDLADLSGNIVSMGVVTNEYISARVLSSLGKPGAAGENYVEITPKKNGYVVLQIVISSGTNGMVKTYVNYGITVRGIYSMAPIVIPSIFAKNYYVRDSEVFGSLVQDGFSLLSVEPQDEVSRSIAVVSAEYSVLNVAPKKVGETNLTLKVTDGTYLDDHNTLRILSIPLTVKVRAFNPFSDLDLLTVILIFAALAYVLILLFVWLIGGYRKKKLLAIEEAQSKTSIAVRNVVAGANSSLGTSTKRYEGITTTTAYQPYQLMGATQAAPPVATLNPGQGNSVKEETKRTVTQTTDYAPVQAVVKDVSYSASTVKTTDYDAGSSGYGGKPSASDDFANLSDEEILRRVYERDYKKKNMKNKKTITYKEFIKDTELCNRILSEYRSQNPKQNSRSAGSDRFVDREIEELRNELASAADAETAQAIYDRLKAARSKMNDISGSGSSARFDKYREKDKKSEQRGEQADAKAKEREEKFEEEAKRKNRDEDAKKGIQDEEPVFDPSDEAVLKNAYDLGYKDTMKYRKFIKDADLCNRILAEHRAKQQHAQAASASEKPDGFNSVQFSPDTVEVKIDPKTLKIEDGDTLETLIEKKLTLKTEIPKIVAALAAIDAKNEVDKKRADEEMEQTQALDNEIMELKNKLAETTDKKAGQAVQAQIRAAETKINELKGDIPKRFKEYREQSEKLGQLRDEYSKAKATAELAQMDIEDKIEELKKDGAKPAQDVKPVQDAKSDAGQVRTSEPAPDAAANKMYERLNTTIEQLKDELEAQKERSADEKREFLDAMKKETPVVPVVEESVKDEPTPEEILRRAYEVDYKNKMKYRDFIKDEALRDRILAEYNAKHNPEQTAQPAASVAAEPVTGGVAPETVQMKSAEMDKLAENLLKAVNEQNRLEISRDKAMLNREDAENAANLAENKLALTDSPEERARLANELSYRRRDAEEYGRKLGEYEEYLAESQQRAAEYAADLKAIAAEYGLEQKLSAIEVAVMKQDFEHKLEKERLLAEKRVEIIKNQTERERMQESVGVTTAVQREAEPVVTVESEDKEPTPEEILRYAYEHDYKDKMKYRVFLKDTELCDRILADYRAKHAPEETAQPEAAVAVEPATGETAPEAAQVKETERDERAENLSRVVTEEVQPEPAVIADFTDHEPTPEEILRYAYEHEYKDTMKYRAFLQDTELCGRILAEYRAEHGPEQGVIVAAEPVNDLSATDEIASKIYEQVNAGIERLKNELDEQKERAAAERQELLDAMTRAEDAYRQMQTAAVSPGVTVDFAPIKNEIEALRGEYAKAKATDDLAKMDLEDKIEELKLDIQSNVIIAGANETAASNELTNNLYGQINAGIERLKNELDAQKERSAAERRELLDAMARTEDAYKQMQTVSNETTAAVDITKAEPPVAEVVKKAPSPEEIEAKAKEMDKLAEALLKAVSEQNRLTLRGDGVLFSKSETEKDAELAEARAALAATPEEGARFTNEAADKRRNAEEYDGKLLEYEEYVEENQNRAAECNAALKAIADEYGLAAKLSDINMALMKQDFESKVEKERLLSEKRFEAMRNQTERDRILAAAVKAKAESAVTAEPVKSGPTQKELQAKAKEMDKLADRLVKAAKEQNRLALRCDGVRFNKEEAEKDAALADAKTAFAATPEERARLTNEASFKRRDAEDYAKKLLEYEEEITESQAQAADCDAELKQIADEYGLGAKLSDISMALMKQDFENKVEKERLSAEKRFEGMKNQAERDRALTAASVAAQPKPAELVEAEEPVKSGPTQKELQAKAKEMDKLAEKLVKAAKEQNRLALRAESVRFGKEEAEKDAEFAEAKTAFAATPEERARFTNEASFKRRDAEDYAKKLLEYEEEISESETQAADCDAELKQIADEYGLGAKLSDIAMALMKQDFENKVEKERLSAEKRFEGMKNQAERDRILAAASAAAQTKPVEPAIAAEPVKSGPTEEEIQAKAKEIDKLADSLLKAAKEQNRLALRAEGVRFSKEEAEKDAELAEERMMLTAMPEEKARFAAEASYKRRDAEDYARKALECEEDIAEAQNKAAEYDSAIKAIADEYGLGAKLADISMALMKQDFENKVEKERLSAEKKIEAMKNQTERDRILAASVAAQTKPAEPAAVTETAKSGPTQEEIQAKEREMDKLAEAILKAVSEQNRLALRADGVSFNREEAEKDAELAAARMAYSSNPEEAARLSTAVTDKRRDAEDYARKLREYEEEITDGESKAAEYDVALKAIAEEYNLGQKVSDVGVALMKQDLDYKVEKERLSAERRIEAIKNQTERDRILAVAVKAKEDQTAAAAEPVNIGATQEEIQAKAQEMDKLADALLKAVNDRHRTALRGEGIRFNKEEAEKDAELAEAKTAFAVAPEERARLAAEADYKRRDAEDYARKLVEHEENMAEGESKAAEYDAALKAIADEYGLGAKLSDIGVALMKQDFDHKVEKERLLSEKRIEAIKNQTERDRNLAETKHKAEQSAIVAEPVKSGPTQEEIQAKAREMDKLTEALIKAVGEQNRLTLRCDAVNFSREEAGKDAELARARTAYAATPEEDARLAAEISDKNRAAEDYARKLLEYEQEIADNQSKAAEYDGAIKQIADEYGLGAKLSDINIALMKRDFEHKVERERLSAEKRFEAMKNQADRDRILIAAQQDAEGGADDALSDEEILRRAYEREYKDKMKYRKFLKDDDLCDKILAGYRAEHGIKTQPDAAAEPVKSGPTAEEIRAKEEEMGKLAEALLNLVGEQNRLALHCDAVSFNREEAEKDAELARARMALAATPEEVAYFSDEAAGDRRNAEECAGKLLEYEQTAAAADAQAAEYDASLKAIADEYNLGQKLSDITIALMKQDFERKVEKERLSAERRVEAIKNQTERDRILAAAVKAKADQTASATAASVKSGPAQEEIQAKAKEMDKLAEALLKAVNDRHRTALRGEGIRFNREEAEKDAELAESKTAFAATPEERARLAAEADYKRRDAEDYARKLVEHEENMAEGESKAAEYDAALKAIADEYGLTGKLSEIGVALMKQDFDHKVEKERLLSEKRIEAIKKQTERDRNLAEAKQKAEQSAVVAEPVKSGPTQEEIQAKAREMDKLAEALIKAVSEQNRLALRADGVRFSKEEAEKDAELAAARMAYSSNPEEAARLSAAVTDKRRDAEDYARKLREYEADIADGENKAVECDAALKEIAQEYNLGQKMADVSVALMKQDLDYKVEKERLSAERRIEAIKTQTERDRILAEAAKPKAESVVVAEPVKSGPTQEEVQAKAKEMDKLAEAFIKAVSEQNRLALRADAVNFSREEAEKDAELAAARAAYAETHEEKARLSAAAADKRRDAEDYARKLRECEQDVNEIQTKAAEYDSALKKLADEYGLGSKLSDVTIGLMKQDLEYKVERERLSAEKRFEAIKNQTERDRILAEAAKPKAEPVVVAEPVKSGPTQEEIQAKAREMDKLAEALIKAVSEQNRLALRADNVRFNREEAEKDAELAAAKTAYAATPEEEARLASEVSYKRRDAEDYARKLREYEEEITDGENKAAEYDSALKAIAQEYNLGQKMSDIGVALMKQDFEHKVEKERLSAEKRFEAMRNQAERDRILAAAAKPKPAPVPAEPVKSGPTQEEIQAKAREMDKLAEALIKAVSEQNRLDLRADNVRFNREEAEKDAELAAARAAYAATPDEKARLSAAVTDKRRDADDYARKLREYEEEITDGENKAAEYDAALKAIAQEYNLGQKMADVSLALMKQDLEYKVEKERLSAERRIEAIKNQTERDRILAEAAKPKAEPVVVAEPVKSGPTQEEIQAKAREMDKLAEALIKAVSEQNRLTLRADGVVFNREEAEKDAELAAARMAYASNPEEAARLSAAVTDKRRDAEDYAKKLREYGADIADSETKAAEYDAALKAIAQEYNLGQKMADVGVALMKQEFEYKVEKERLSAERRIEAMKNQTERDRILAAAKAKAEAAAEPVKIAEPAAPTVIIDQTGKEEAERKLRELQETLKKGNLNDRLKTRRMQLQMVEDDIPAMRDPVRGREMLQKVEKIENDLAQDERISDIMYRIDRIRAEIRHAIDMLELKAQLAARDARPQPAPAPAPQQPPKERTRTVVRKITNNITKKQTTKKAAPGQRPLRPAQRPVRPEQRYAGGAQRPTVRVVQRPGTVVQRPLRPEQRYAGGGAQRPAVRVVARPGTTAQRPLTAGTRPTAPAQRPVSRQSAPGEQRPVRR